MNYLESLILAAEKITELLEEEIFLVIKDSRIHELFGNEEGFEVEPGSAYIVTIAVEHIYRKGAVLIGYVFFYPDDKNVCFRDKDVFEVSFHFRHVFLNSLGLSGASRLHLCTAG